jgi:predicted HTH domain antitoxin
VDIVDYRLLRAAAQHQRDPVDSEAARQGLTNEQASAVDDVQERYNLVLGYFLSGGLSLSRAAELLDTTYMDLRIRLHRLGLPTFQGPQTIEEARQEVAAARAISRTSR